MGNNLEKVYILTIGKEGEYQTDSYVEEFKRLLFEIGYEVEKVFYQVVEIPNKVTFVGKGKIEEIRDYFLSNDKKVSKLACAYELSAVQRKNIEKITNMKVFDRTQVILDIFDNNAKTREAKLQVEIAKLNYSKTHLINEHAEYSQVTSGSGHNKGEGEKALELERRRIADNIHQKKKELNEIKESRSNSRNLRRKSVLPKIAIVGYTNAGKSTLMNKLLSASKALDKKSVLQKDALFATLETNTRLINVFPYPNFMLTDTVGFVSNLPIYLIDAFRSTLEEVTEADLLIQVVDSSSFNCNQEMAATNQVLRELNVNTENMIYLFNKYDLLIEKTQGTGFAQLPKKNERYVSLKNDEDISEIVSFICDSFTNNWNKKHLIIPYDIDINSFSQENLVLSCEEKENGHAILAKLNPFTEYKYKDYLEE